MQNSEKDHIFSIYQERKYIISNSSLIKPNLIISSALKQGTLNKNGMNSWGNLYNKFDDLAKSFIEINQITDKITLYKRIEPFIGKKIENEDELNEWKKIKEKMIKKINKKSEFSIYYKGLLEFLFGKEIEENENKKIDCDILSR